ncbi:hypothetical protein SAICODRAFT_70542 [Saitoella complicata NRRL Y-17804]|uniref:uncharacterized protein n=1 Tax=Saitoella complicata (strain BCRC 22490 / CBS 7301 / JCM 7358 / NBRC 10748 / NRRL Y-17804) TaxID=698492 RepID=UPI0008668457|nr:uncharacterized protein SAICODRAFT_70542 [Saitoella complicata NRRL Y-17804]ODQ53841.1 hypothetical protein SAICODRAFT_70542 [Saitoella complicata NRRL Y-17804]
MSSDFPLGTIPERLRCSNCQQFVKRPYKTPCCEQSICGNCRDDLPPSCPICDHSPTTPEDCTENPSLKTTVAVFLRMAEKKWKDAQTKEAKKRVAEQFNVQGSGTDPDVPTLKLEVSGGQKSDEVQDNTDSDNNTAANGGLADLSAQWSVQNQNPYASASSMMGLYGNMGTSGMFNPLSMGMGGYPIVNMRFGAVGGTANGGVNGKGDNWAAHQQHHRQQQHQSQRPVPVERSSDTMAHVEAKSGHNMQDLSGSESTNGTAKHELDLTSGPNNTTQKLDPDNVQARIDAIIKASASASPAPPSDMAPKPIAHFPAGHAMYASEVGDLGGMSGSYQQYAHGRAIQAYRGAWSMGTHPAGRGSSTLPPAPVIVEGAPIGPRSNVPSIRGGRGNFRGGMQLRGGFGSRGRTGHTSDLGNILGAMRSHGPQDEPMFNDEYRGKSASRNIVPSPEVAKGRDQCRGQDHAAKSTRRGIDFVRDREPDPRIIRSAVAPLVARIAAAEVRVRIAVQAEAEAERDMRSGVSIGPRVGISVNLLRRGDPGQGLGPENRHRQDHLALARKDLRKTPRDAGGVVVLGLDVTEILSHLTSPRAVADETDRPHLVKRGELGNATGMIEVIVTEAVPAVGRETHLEARSMMMGKRWKNAKRAWSEREKKSGGKKGDILS